MSYNMSNRSNLERSGRMEYISPMSDVIFKQMFSREENKDMLRGLVKAFLEVDIGNDFKIAGNELPPYNPDEKFPRIDLHASSNIGEVDIEVQVSTDSNFTQRFTNYAIAALRFKREAWRRYLQAAPRNGVRDTQQHRAAADRKMGHRI